jgi:hypothetical protein
MKPDRREFLPSRSGVSVRHATVAGGGSPAAGNVLDSSYAGAKMKR